MAPASAQVWGMRGSNLWGYNGVLPPYGTIPSPIPNTWITPDYVFEYQVPQVVYVPVPVQVAPKQPAFEPVHVATITLPRGAAPADARVKAGTVVTWSNDDNQDDILVIAPTTSSGTESGDTSQRWRVPARGSFSLAFHQPGSYDYYRLEEPDQRARLIVTE
jgi:plastocyanin